MDPTLIDPHRPSYADDVRLGVPDAQVIDRTLPSAPSPMARLQTQAGHAVGTARDYVTERPVQSVLLAAAGGAALTAGLLAWIRAERIERL